MSSSEVHNLNLSRHKMDAYFKNVIVTLLEFTPLVWDVYLLALLYSTDSLIFPLSDEEIWGNNMKSNRCK